MARAVVVALAIAIGVGLYVGALPGYPYPTVWGTVVNVIDGNQIVVQIAGSSAGDWIVGSLETVRYLGSYASPGGTSACDMAAPSINYQMTFQQLVYLEFDQVIRDAEGKLLAYVYLDGAGLSMVNAMLVAMGITKATAEEPNTRYSSVFLGLEATAIQFGLGCTTP